MDQFIQILKESKRAKTDFNINELSQNRWSPRAFADQAIDKSKLMSMMEAAKWTASAFNEQPWRFIIGEKGDETFHKILDTLVEFNQNWAKNASVLILNISKDLFTHNNQTNATAKYDLGQAVSSYCLEAVHQDLITHQMSGFDADKAHKSFGLTEGYSCVSVTAVGYLTHPESLPEELFKVELQNRLRKTVDQFAFTDQLNQQAFKL